MMASPKTVLITGASRGLGRALVDELAGRGCVVYPLVRSASMATALEVAKSVHPIVGDVSSDNVVQEIQTALDKNGSQLDILINNAGTRGYLLSIEDGVEEEVRALLEVHCLGALRVARAALPYLRKSLAPLVVNITSRLGSIRRTSSGDFLNERLSYSYRIAKAAQNMMTLCLDQELRPQGITVYAVHPGPLKTESGPPDATTSAGEGALRLADWLMTSDSSVAGTYRELDAGYNQW